MKMPKIADLQNAIDTQIAKRGLDKYVDYVQYLPADGQPPADATHVVSVASVESGAKVEVAVKAKGLYSAIADVVLGVL